MDVPFVWKALRDQAAITTWLEGAREELSNLQIKVSNDCQDRNPLQTIKTPSLFDITTALENKNIVNVPTRIADIREVPFMKVALTKGTTVIKDLSPIFT